MRTFIALILWAFLFIACWPIALMILILFPFVWLIILPFRLVGLSIDILFKLIKAILTLPFKIMQAI